MTFDPKLLIYDREVKGKWIKSSQTRVYSFIVMGATSVIHKKGKLQDRQERFVAFRPPDARSQCLLICCLSYANTRGLSSVHSSFTGFVTLFSNVQVFISELGHNNHHHAVRSGPQEPQRKPRRPSPLLIIITPFS